VTTDCETVKRAAPKSKEDKDEDKQQDLHADRKQR
jgi:hypothetical protein